LAVLTDMNVCATVATIPAKEMFSSSGILVNFKCSSMTPTLSILFIYLFILSKS